MTNPKPEPTSVPAARDCAIYILSQMADKYVHPEEYAKGKEQSVIDRQVEMATERIEQYCASQLAAKDEAQNEMLKIAMEQITSLKAELQRVSGERDTALASSDFWERELNNFRRNAAHRAEQLAAEKVSELERQVAELREAQRWIRVSERLPKDDSTVLARVPFYNSTDNSLVEIEVVHCSYYEGGEGSGQKMFVTCEGDEYEAEEVNDWRSWPSEGKDNG